MKKLHKYVYELIDYMKKYLGKSIDEISELTSFHTKAKNKNYLVLFRLASSFLGEDFLKALIEEEHLNFKTVNLNRNGKPEEAMSFPAFSFAELAKEEWETSTLRKTFSDPFIFLVVKRYEDGNRFENIFLWEMPEEDLEGEVKIVWEMTKTLIQEGYVIKSMEEVAKLHFPRASETKICHVRPHGRNSLDIIELPKEDQLTHYLGATRQSFWLNRDYICDIIVHNS